ncbi:MAG: hypothetical protein JHD16_04590 [Solirubrobacteraceae bacterium]|nr:hypothetical protein [Solirubrobacteraceae bacterium]
MLLQFLIVMAIAAAVVWFVSAPLRRGAVSLADAQIDPRLLAERDRAQLAKDRKLDEIRELRADRAAGKITEADAAPLERELRSQAADLLHKLDDAEAAIDEAQSALDARKGESAGTDERPLP